MVEYVADWKKTAGNNGGFQNRVITGDKSWCYKYDLELKTKSKEWKVTNVPEKKMEKCDSRETVDTSCA